MDFMAKTYTVEEVDEIAVKLIELKELKEEATKKLKGITETFDLVKASFAEAMEEVGKSSWKIEGIGSFSISEKSYPRIIKDHESVKSFMSWMQGKGEDFYLSHVTVNPQTLGRMIREEKEKDPLIEVPGVDATYIKKTISIRKK